MRSLRPRRMRWLQFSSMSKRNMNPFSLVPAAAVGQVSAPATPDSLVGFPPMSVFLPPLAAAHADRLQRHQCAPGNSRSYHKYLSEKPPESCRKSVLP